MPPLIQGGPPALDSSFPPGLVLRGTTAWKRRDPVPESPNFTTRFSLSLLWGWRCQAAPGCPWLIMGLDQEQEATTSEETERSDGRGLHETCRGIMALHATLNPTTQGILMMWVLDVFPRPVV